ncbi:type I restriction enzyme EcoKI specificity protein [Streptococcus pneumoniae]|nr:type I restriction enzyme EcoKI specificity protein [Streptococcus pneumoniae]
MNWVVIKIKDIFSMNTGLSYKKGDLSINNKGVRIIRGGNIKPLEFLCWITITTLIHNSSPLSKFI